VLANRHPAGHAAALNIACGERPGELVLLADGTAWPAGDALTPLADTLTDPEIAIVGSLRSDIDRTRTPSTFSSRRLGCARRRSFAGRLDRVPARRLHRLGPLDERFVTPAWLDVWWSLRLRAGADPE